MRNAVYIHIKGKGGGAACTVWPDDRVLIMFNHQWLLNITDSPKFASNPGISTRDRAANRSNAAVPFAATIALDSPIPAPQHSYPMPHADRDASSHRRFRREPQALFF